MVLHVNAESILRDYYLSEHCGHKFIIPIASFMYLFVKSWPCWETNRPQCRECCSDEEVSTPQLAVLKVSMFRHTTFTLSKCQCIPWHSTFSSHFSRIIQDGRRQKTKMTRRFQNVYFLYMSKTVTQLHLNIY